MCAGVGAFSVAFLVRKLKQFVGCMFDLFVVELRCTEMTSDETGSVSHSKNAPLVGILVEPEANRTFSHVDAVRAWRYSTLSFGW